MNPFQRCGEIFDHQALTLGFQNQICIGLVRHVQFRAQFRLAALDLCSDEVQQPALQRLRKGNGGFSRADLRVLPCLEKLEHGGHRSGAQSLADRASRRAATGLANFLRSPADLILRNARAEEEYEEAMHNAALEEAANRIANGEDVSRVTAVEQAKQRQALRAEHDSDPGISIKNGRGDTVDYTISELADPPASSHEAKKHAI
ncbi:conserved hypothetical protein [Ricinus communis]|uniref:Uncharacterized protein n=1 Tax=Ricinus communis TaxID=3988 RepID=B9TMW7_RICCO|nr:conserved hypothetical protein [Ricinus communis]